MFDLDRLIAAHEKAKSLLLAERNERGHWTGELSTSALSTATAISALALMRRNGTSPDPRWRDLIDRGIAYLATHQNADGGFGDTDRSHSNIATTMLVTAAIHLAEKKDELRGVLERADRYIESKGRLAGLRERYGVDKTFVVPILTNCALAGLVPWSAVDALPFEMACVPQSWYRFVGMPVVSYAIPALVAIGQCVHFHRPTWVLPWRWVRAAAKAPSLNVLRRMQPQSGGYLEATPLTSFVVMSLAAIGQANHPVAVEGTRFLVNSVRPDGSWPIDTNLATWVTTLSLLALSGDGSDIASYGDERTLDWILSCQHKVRHPFTGADPGGWGWTDLSGAVPDADDTPSAMLALAGWLRSPALAPERRSEVSKSVGEGMRWLISLQNRDGGWPTFCRGWGKLPFDRSGVDLTAHAIRALRATLAAMESDPESAQFSSFVPEWIGNAAARALEKKTLNPAMRFIESRQRADGSWVPLWFGNQDHPAEENPIYGTAKTVFMYRDLVSCNQIACSKAIDFLEKAQGNDGSWGGTSPEIAGSIEETALATEALLVDWSNPSAREGARRGLAWLCQAIENGRAFDSAPIGFYFAKLWYYERLYPLIFTVSALGRARACETARQQATNSNATESTPTG